MARVQLESKRRVADACQAEVDRLQARLESILMQRLTYQREFNTRLAVTSTSLLQVGHAQLSEQYVGRLTDTATSVGQEIVGARKAVLKADEEVRIAARALRQAMAKLDALINIRDKAQQELNRQKIRIEEEHSEELAVRRQAVV